MKLIYEISEIQVIHKITLVYIINVVIYFLKNIHPNFMNIFFGFFSQTIEHPNPYNLNQI